VTAATANTPVLAANVSGGLIKKGAGTLNLTGANTYSGSNFVSAGTMLITPAHQAAGQPVTVASNAAFGVLANAAGAATVGNLKLGFAAADRTTLAITLGTGSNPTSPVLQSGRTVALAALPTVGAVPVYCTIGTCPRKQCPPTNVWFHD